MDTGPEKYDMLEKENEVLFEKRLRMLHVLYALFYSVPFLRNHPAGKAAWATIKADGLDENWPVEECDCLVCQYGRQHEGELLFHDDETDGPADALLAVIGHTKAAKDALEDLNKALADLATDARKLQGKKPK